MPVAYYVFGGRALRVHPRPISLNAPRRFRLFLPSLPPPASMRVPVSLAQGCTIVSACGFDSIPADMGLAFMVSQFPEGAIPSAAESYLSLHAGTLPASPALPPSLPPPASPGPVPSPPPLLPDGRPQGRGGALCDVRVHCARLLQRGGAPPAASPPGED